MARLHLRLALAGLAAVIAFAGASFVLLAQVEVDGATPAVTRTCGSPLDTMVDRAGWELWWARDLDEPDDAVRSALVRTERCPDVVNQRIGVAATMGVVGVAFTTIAWYRLARAARRTSDRRTGVGHRLTRLGRVTSLTGAVLVIAGVAAIIVLLADADSTLFVYTDRLVVGAIGLIVLTPPLALLAIGRVLAIVGADLGRHEAAHS